MALSKPLFFHLKTLTPRTPRRLPPSLPSFSLRLLSFATPEDAAAERRRRKRRFRIEPPLSSVRHPQPQRSAPRPAQNPNAPKLPDSSAALTGNRLNLHNRILKLIREDDLDEASLLVRHSIYSNCRPTVFTCNAVLSALLRASRYSDLLSLHRFVTQASVAPSLLSHHLLLQAYSDCRKSDAALDHYRLLIKDSPFNPSPTTYRILIKGLVDNNRLDQAIEIKDDMLEKAFFSPDPAVYNLLMLGFIKNDNPDRVIELYEELKEKLGGEAIEDGIVYGNLMKGFFKKGMENEAMECYNEIIGEGAKVRFGAVSYNYVLDALGKNGKLEEAEKLFERMLKEHEPPRRVAVNMGSFNVMVDAYCLAGRFKEAVAVFRRMGEKNCSPDTLSYNNLIEQLGRNRLVEEVEELYKEMEALKISPDEFTYVLLTEACFGVERVDDATGYFRKMVELELRPNANSYNKVIGGLVNAGRLDEARGFFELMVEKEVKPNVLSYEILLKAFIEAERVDDAMKTLRGILMDEGVSLRDEMKELVEAALRKEGREEELGRLFEDVEKEKAEARARAEEEKARAEAVAKAEEERKKAEAAAKEEAKARASRAAIDSILGRKNSSASEEGAKEESPLLGVSSAAGGSPKEEISGSGSAEETKVEEAVVVDLSANGEASKDVNEEVKAEAGDAAEQATTS